MLLAVTVAGISGCGTTVPSKWYHPQITDPSQKMYRFGEDVRVCLRVAQGMAPMPIARTRLQVPPSEPSYDFSGRVRTYGPNGREYSTVSGTLTPTPNFASSFNQSFAISYNVTSDAMEAYERGKVTEAYVSCLNTLGWTDKKPDNHPREDGEPCKASSECEGK